MSASVELKKDLDEVKRLLQLTNRSNVRDLLQGHINTIEKTLLECKEETTESQNASSVPTPAPPTQVKRPLKKITSYAWDQSDAFVKIYATSLAGVQKLATENIDCEFNTLGFNLVVKNLDGKDHQLKIVSLYGQITPEESKIKVKSDSVLIMLKKRKQEKWEGITELDRKKKEKQKLDSAPKSDEDPSASIMNMMKKMYDEGDDDMKRTIAKAWTESQDKKAAGAGLGDL